MGPRRIGYHRRRWFFGPFRDPISAARRIAVVNYIRHHSFINFIDCVLLARGAPLHFTTFSLIRTVITMHITPAEARASGLFGYCENMTLVDARDSRKLARYLHLYQTCSRDRLEDMCQLLEYLSRPEGVEHYVQYEIEDLQDMWLVSNFIKDPDWARDGAEVRLVSLLEDKEEGQRAFWDRREWQYGHPPWRRFRCDRKNEWARRQLARMPDFGLLIMFRLCKADACSLARKVSEDTGLNLSSDDSGAHT
ncbi:hypothetical protein F4775DRAFT_543087 [Biscogniauxia sp. FL1348]|nr:hypothetical protein F4775DRAFT_543087 [Biscogniauxia sp. FL1348]